MMTDGPKAAARIGRNPIGKGMTVRDLQARLSRLCADIALIEEELKKAAQQNRGAAEICNEQVLAEAKSAVDRVRQLLRPYAEAVARRDAGLDQKLQRYRMERVTTLLHDLTDRVSEPRLAALPEAHNFFSSIQKIATTAVERHLLRLTRHPQSRTLPLPETKTFVN